jgi:rhamnosyltransferase subunit B
MAHPSTILLPTFGSLGDINPFIAIALELKSRGHRPIVATMAMHRERIEDEGLEFAPIPPHPESREAWLEVVQKLHNTKEGNTNLFREVLMPCLRQSYEELLPLVEQADLVVSHPLVQASSICCEKVNRPWMAAVVSPVMLWSIHDSMIPVGFKGAEKLRTHPGFQRLLKFLTARSLRHKLREVQALRSELGLHSKLAWPINHTASASAVLMLFSPEIAAPQPDWPANSVQTGFCVYDRKNVGSASDDSPTELMPEIRDFLSHGEPPLVFTLGSQSVFKATDYYTATVEATRKLNQRAILLIGNPDNRPASLSQNDSQIAAFPYAPYSELFPHAKAIVHPGGIGTIGQALSAGVPSLIIPQIHDQFDNAWRAQRRGYARIMMHGDLNHQQLTQQLEALLNDPQYTQNAKAASERMQQENGVAIAADAIENILNQKAL